MKKIFAFLVFSALFFLTAKPAFAAVTFRLEPASGTIKIGEATPVKIVLNTGGATTGAISVILSFDATKLSAGSSLTPGVFSLVLVNSVDNSTGKIRFDAGSSTNQSGDGITVATINFSGKAAGTTQVNFTQVKAVDAQTNQYLTTSSTGGSYTVAAAEATPTPPGATPTPTPTSPPGTTPTPTPTPTSGPTPTPTSGAGGPGPTSTPTPTPTTVVRTTLTPTPTTSPEELPEAGNITPTFILIGFGILVLTSGLLLLF